jgi:3-oxoacyl-[acyl-carrier protein] reductase
MSNLKVMVTGGSRGIGRAIALRFAREGAQVVVAARTASDLDQVAKEIDAAGGQGVPCQMNVADLGNVEAGLWRALEATDGVLDVLVNNAGVFDVKPIWEMRAADFTRVLEVNLFSAFYATREALDGLFKSKRGHVFNISSIAGKQGFAGCTAYSASKYGMRGFSDSLREDLREKGVRVTTVYPKATDTRIFEGVAGEWDRSTMDKPEKVAEVVWRTYSAPTGASVDDVDV